MREVIISEIDAHQRIDKFLMKYLNKCPKSYLYKCFRTKKIKHNGKKPKGNEILQPNDIIKIFLHEEQLKQFEGQRIIKQTKQSFKVVYEDDNLLIADKPLGLLTQKDKKDGHSLGEEVLSYLTKKEPELLHRLKGFTPAPCNRLDRNTAGIVLVGKNLPATQAISEMLRTKQISKYYMSIVLGRLTEPLTLKAYHIKEEGRNEVKIIDNYVEGAKPVETKILPLHTNGRYTLIEVQLVTGKTHQIRAHLSHVGHPIIGDPKYGDQLENSYFVERYGLKYQLLCAYKIKFELPLTPFEYLQERVFTVTAPSVYAEICKEEGLLAL